VPLFHEGRCVVVANVTLSPLLFFVFLEGLDATWASVLSVSICVQWFSVLCDYIVSGFATAACFLCAFLYTPFQKYTNIHICTSIQCFSCFPVMIFFRSSLMLNLTQAHTLTCIYTCTHTFGFFTH
jgi:hypothetical protein